MSEMNGKYVNEEKHKKWKKRLTIIGSAMLAVGVVVALWGIIKFVKGIIGIGNSASSDNPGELIKNSGMGNIFGILLLGVGVLIAFVGAVVLVSAFRREITSIGASAVAPVAKEVVDYATDKDGNEAEPSKKVSDENEKHCQGCGAKNAKTASFCIQCGKKFE